jgi:hypothetical protein
MAVGDFVETLFSALLQSINHLSDSASANASSVVPIDLNKRWLADEVAQVLHGMASSEAPEKMVLFLAPHLQELLQLCAADPSSSSSTSSPSSSSSSSSSSSLAQQLQAQVLFETAAPASAAAPAPAIAPAPASGKKQKKKTAAVAAAATVVEETSSPSDDDFPAPSAPVSVCSVLARAALLVLARTLLTPWLSSSQQQQSAQALQPSSSSPSSSSSSSPAAIAVASLLSLTRRVCASFMLESASTPSALDSDSSYKFNVVASLISLQVFAHSTPSASSASSASTAATAAGTSRYPLFLSMLDTLSAAVSASTSSQPQPQTAIHAAARRGPAHLACVLDAQEHVVRNLHVLLQNRALDPQIFIACRAELTACLNAICASSAAAIELSTASSSTKKVLEENTSGNKLEYINNLAKDILALF